MIQLLPATGFNGNADEYFVDKLVWHDALFCVQFSNKIKRKTNEFSYQ